MKSLLSRDSAADWKAHWVTGSSLRIADEGRMFRKMMMRITKVKMMMRVMMMDDNEEDQGYHGHDDDHDQIMVAVNVDNG